MTAAFMKAAMCPSNIRTEAGGNDRNVVLNTVSFAARERMPSPFWYRYRVTVRQTRDPRRGRRCGRCGALAILGAVGVPSGAVSGESAEGTEVFAPELQQVEG